jgi:hypothetical protein
MLGVEHMKFEYFKAILGFRHTNIAAMQARCVGTSIHFAGQLAQTKLWQINGIRAAYEAFF